MSDAAKKAKASSVRSRLRNLAREQKRPFDLLVQRYAIERSRYLVVAEKYEAMVKLGEGNSRMKDFYDLWLIARTFDLEPATLREAITHTFARRQTALPASRPVALSPTFSDSPIKQQQWKAFTTKAKVANEVPDLAQVCDVIWALLEHATTRTHG
jgi:hypothetical protein